MSTLGESALAYARARIPVLFVAGKHPVTARGVHGATVDLIKLGFYTRNLRSPSLGVALAMGHPYRDGFLFALDVDVQHDGDFHLAELEAEFGELPETRTHGTPSGGWHLLFRSPEPVRCRVGIRPGIDVRGQGGYVVAPPSPGYTVAKRAPVAWAPQWLLDMIEPPARREYAHTLDADAPVHPRYVEVAVARECEALASAPEGTRNHTLNVAAFSLARFVAAGQADAEAVIRALYLAASEAGLDDIEIEKTIRSAFQARGVAA